ncbi:MAG: UvrD-helicase domain-containing protein [Pseudomonadota bacterium]
MIYFADLHIHSKYSRATSPDCNLIELARWAALKGLRVIATGDLTHPEWSREILEKLEEDGEGLLRLKKEYLPESAGLPGGFGPGDVRFVLNVEISSIYKKHGVVRKVHNLIFVPDFPTMDRFRTRLDRIGNIKSDGRPILGLDSRDLLETALETSADSFLIPAHVWTPWFSILGSKSGFDSVEECFGDLTPHIFALETGLSSDPEMNHQVASLDRYTLISNSDTHSPSKLGREANIFTGTPGYREIREAIRLGGAAFREEGQALDGLDSARFAANTAETANGFIGTIEFFPEEGKYHLDGHRKCSMRLEPEETESLGGRCPVCGKPLTVGVMSRVMELAERGRGEFPERAAPFWRMLPLVEVVAQALGTGPQSKKVSVAYMELLRKLGPELTILWTLPLDDIAARAPEIIVEGIRRVRKGEITIRPGFDGEYGEVELFAPGERDRFAGQESWIALGVSPKAAAKRARPVKAKVPKTVQSAPRNAPHHDHGLNREQKRAVEILDRPVLVHAGPGTGKTRTLTRRIAELLRTGQAEPQAITAVTFTRKAAEEMRDRLRNLLPVETASRCWVGTFHQLGIRLLDELHDNSSEPHRIEILDEDDTLKLFRQAVKSAGLELAPARIPSSLAEVSLLKQNLTVPEECPVDSDIGRAYRAYENALRSGGVLDLDDLLVLPVRALLARQTDRADRPTTGRTTHLLVDEFQDVNRAQYEMVKILAGPDARGLFAIGDPDQAIYGFRGADRNLFFKFTQDFSEAEVVRLTRNYRSHETVLKAARQVLGGHGSAGDLTAERPGGALLRVVSLPNASLEAKFIVKTIDRILGGASFLSIDSGTEMREDTRLGFNDIAVLFRLNAVGDVLEEAFQASGIPYQRARRSDPRGEAEEIDPRAEAVTLMTMHASKGLEFPVVFIAGCEDGVIPYVPNDEEKGSATDLDEERRLLYVAMTRAAGDLIVSRSEKRTLFGQTLSAGASRFLSAIDASLCGHSDPLRAGRPSKRSRLRQCELFASDA